jgi:fumarate hydratase class II
MRATEPIAQKAMREDLTLKAEALASGDVDEATCDRRVKPLDMVGSGTVGV